MQNITLDNITQAAINHGDRGKSHPRLHEIYASLVQHLHDFVRETNLTELELQQGRDFLNRASRYTQEVPTGEIHMLTDLLGISEMEIPISTPIPHSRSSLRSSNWKNTIEAIAALPAMEKE
jgi:catechol 1,2-dioxygenase/hydroxyquinol 1,2-dioxygenase